MIFWDVEMMCFVCGTVVSECYKPLAIFVERARSWSDSISMPHVHVIRAKRIRIQGERFLVQGSAPVIL